MRAEWAIPSVPWQCAATSNPRRRACSTISRVVSASYCALRGDEFFVRLPPVAMILMRSTPCSAWRSMTVSAASASHASPPQKWQWPPTDVTGWPAQSNRGPGCPAAMRSRRASSSHLPPPRSRALVMPARTMAAARWFMSRTSFSSGTASWASGVGRAGSRVMWTWASIRPGMTVSPDRSRWSLSGAAPLLSPTAAMRPASTASTSALAYSRATPSQMRTLRKTVRCIPAILTRAPNAATHRPRMEQTPSGAQRPAALVPYQAGVAGPEAAPVPSGSAAPDRLWGACTPAH